MRKITNDQLNELNIFALRELARQTGVNSPTSKKKDQLIKEILDIQAGNTQPYVAKTKQGRPPKSVSYGFADLFEFHNFFKPVAPVVTLRQDNISTDNQEVYTQLGYVEILENQSAFLWVQSDFYYQKYFVSADIVKNYELKFGDKVLAVVGGANNMVVIDVCNINDFPVASLPKSKKDYSKIDAQIPSHAMSFVEKKYEKFLINCGENVYIYGSNNNQNTIAVLDLLKQCKADCKIYVNLCVAEKNKVYLKHDFGVEFLSTNFMVGKDVATKVVALAIERAKRAFEQGKSVVLAVDDILSIASIDPDFNLVKQIVTLAKDSKRAGQISTFVVVPSEKDLYIIEKLADKRLKIIGNEIVLI